MRLVIGLILALGLAVPAHAQQPAPLPVAAGEVLFEVRVTGIARSAADMAVVNLFYSSRGPTAREARSAVVAMRQRLEATARDSEQNRSPLRQVRWA